MIDTVKDTLSNLINSTESELKNNILQFWIDHDVDNENGGFYGYISNDLVIDKTHNKASVLNARILWTFSTACRVYGDKKYLAVAERAYDYIVKYFIDEANSGVYWLLDYKGNVIDSKNQIYSIAFMIYGMSEFYRAAGRKESLDLAIKLYRSIEDHAYDNDNGGYIEAMTNDWQPLSDMSLSPRDMNVSKSMNTHLHVMEAYTNLLRVWSNDELRNSLEKLVNITINYIIDPNTYQFKLFFDKNWTSLSGISSFGHDIEGSWLLYEAAEVLGNEELLAKVRKISVNMAEKALERGTDKKNGGLFYEEENGVLTGDQKEWWPQAESVVGFLNAYQLAGYTYFLIEAIKTWNFINNHIIDKKHGEWFWGTTADGICVTDDQKVGPWKCPYHNSRMCFEILHRFK